jgi:hypothetical protein
MEYLQIPPMYAEGKYRSWNTCNEDLVVLKMFIELFKPLSILELGTFEARTTEYFFNLLRFYKRGSKPKESKLVTIDVPGCIDRIDENSVSYSKDSLFEDVLKVRKLRLDLMKHSDEIDVIYVERLVSQVLKDVLDTYEFDFIYHDASHLFHLMKNEWNIFEQSNIKRGTIICFDDGKVDDCKFYHWLLDKKMPNWIIKFNDNERGQIWMEKI